MKPAFEKEIRRVRLISAIRLFLPAVLLFAVVAYLGIAWKGHAVLHLVFQLVGAEVPEGRLLTLIFYSLIVISSLGTFLLFRHIVRKPLFQDFPYCRRCDAFDFDETGHCAACGSILNDKASFFFLEYDDERKTLASFGLVETKRTSPPPL
ncbi:MAG TPA: hypothetical protein VG734_18150 [Lacunisphaera sp.]|nr:hypothetical protein [Lacunisphaera sp.]